MKHLFLVFFLCLNLQALSNVAQPGIWNAGGAGPFFLLHPEDSLSFQKIQMVQEMVKVQLYKGVAVVKGVYQMHNPTQDDFSLQVGYPLNAFYDPSASHRKMEIRFDDLYGLKVRVKGIPVEVYLDSMGGQGSGVVGASEWYVWETHFSPGEITTLEVQFMVNTNDASVLEGYDRGNFNAFIYLLESGSTWKQPVGKGTIMIELMGGLTLKDIRGVAPDRRFLVNEARNVLVWRFENLEPSAADNPVITYGKRLEDFQFDQVLLDKEKIFFPSIEAMNHREILGLDLQPYEFGDPFDSGTSGGMGPSGLFSMFSVRLLLIPLILLVLIYFYFRSSRARGGKSKKP